ncbi:MAG TPA: DUF742 domain-containing protein [Cellulomonas sp.]
MSELRHEHTPTGCDLPGVRPYVVTEGRVRGPVEVHVDTLVHRLRADPDPRTLSTETRAILRQVAADHLTVAEVSAHLRMPLGVTQVLVGDLAGLGMVGLRDTAAEHAAIRAAGGSDDAPGRHAALDLLESVAHGIADL